MGLKTTGYTPITYTSSSESRSDNTNNEITTRVGTVEFFEADRHNVSQGVIPQGVKSWKIGNIGNKKVSIDTGGGESPLHVGTSVEGGSYIDLLKNEYVESPAVKWTCKEAGQKLTIYIKH